ncbi:hypothetical protein BS78_01G375100 [Paspalum vaginatum]|nr:hypothetical protein BS78_01G375100 [Paspalum vaginatum]
MEKKEKNQPPFFFAPLFPLPPPALLPPASTAVSQPTRLLILHRRRVAPSAFSSDPSPCPLPPQRPPAATRIAVVVPLQTSVATARSASFVAQRDDRSGGSFSATTYPRVGSGAPPPPPPLRAAGPSLGARQRPEPGAAAPGAACLSRPCAPGEEERGREGSWCKSSKKPLLWCSDSR